MVDTYVADEDVATQVTIRILNSDLPSKMRLSSAAKRKGALSYAYHLIEHVEKIGKYSSNKGYITDMYREITQLFHTHGQNNENQIMTLQIDRERDLKQTDAIATTIRLR